MVNKDEESMDALYPEEAPQPPAPPPPPEYEPEPEPEYETEKSLGRGIVSAVGATIGYLIIPLALWYYLVQVTQILTLQMNTEIAIIIVGIPLVIVAFFSGYNAKDPKLASITQLLQTILTIIYLFGLLGRGPIQINADPIFITLDITLYFYLLLIGTMLHGLSPAWDLIQYYRE